MKRIVRILHHRSLSAAILAIVFGFLAFGLLQGYEWHEDFSDLFQIGIIALLGMIVCFGTFIMLLKDEKSGYPAFRLSLATMLWALACLPVVSLFITVTEAVYKFSCQL